jgi:hypothetical protein
MFAGVGKFPHERRFPHNMHQIKSETHCDTTHFNFELSHYDSLDATPKPLRDKGSGTGYTVCKGGAPMAAAAHGTISAYRGSATREPCRCATCKEAWNSYMRKRRTQSVPERSKTRKPTNVVVQMPTARATTQPAASDGTPGEQECAVIAQLETIDCKDVALVARCRKMAEILDDPNQQGHWIQASKSLDAMMTRAQTGRKRKSNTGKLAIMNQMGRKQTGTQ